MLGRGEVLGYENFYLCFCGVWKLFPLWWGMKIFINIFTEKIFYWDNENIFPWKINLSWCTSLLLGYHFDFWWLRYIRVYRYGPLSPLFYNGDSSKIGKSPPFLLSLSYGSHVQRLTRKMHLSWYITVRTRMLHWSEMIVFFCFLYLSFINYML